MRIVRFLWDRQARYGLVEGELLYPCLGDPFTNLVKYGRPVDPALVRFLAPVDPPNIIGVGLNYRKHAEEAGMTPPAEPILFLKATTSLCSNGDAIVLPLNSPNEIDYEVELAIVIRKAAKHVSEADAPSVILGYTIANDVSNRAVQFGDGQWARGKSYDTFCPLGPAVETDLHPDQLALTCRIDGCTMQASNTSDMIFSCYRLVAYLSECMTLLPGTVILTGTPEGVGFARNPPCFLQEGQVVECVIEGIGTLTNSVVREGGQGLSEGG